MKFHVRSAATVFAVLARFRLRTSGRIGSLSSYMEGGRSSARLTWERSGFSPKDVDVAQIYDGFSASVIYLLLDKLHHRLWGKRDNAPGLAERVINRKDRAGLWPSLTSRAE